MHMNVLLRAALAFAVTVVVAAPAVSAQSAASRGPAVTEADIQFMQDMQVHHEQALELAALVGDRTRRSNLRLLALHITVSQQGEIAQMRGWLAAQGVDTARAMSHDMNAHASGGGHERMPGMVSQSIMNELRRSSGARFEKLFLRSMIQHHDGALTMVKTLLALPGAAQESAVNHFVSEVESSQSAEIARMKRLLSSM